MALLVLSSVLLCTPASARTWRVLRDGSGDFTTLLPACDAAAAGDTIWVGPGRYTEFEVRPLSAVVSRPVFMLINDEDITVTGAHRDSVVIGPEALTVSTIGIAQYYLEAGGLLASSVTLVNFDCGFEASASLTVRDVFFRDGLQAISVANGSMTVEGAEFVSNDTGVAGYAGSHDLVVRDCVFRDNRGGCNFTFSLDPVVERCTFTGGRVAVVASGTGVDLVITNSSVEGAEVGGIAIGAGATLRAYDNSITASGEVALSLGGGDFVELRRNLIYGSTWATLHLSAQRGTFLVKNNEFQRGSGMLVRARNYSIEADSISIDLSGNFWNTTDPDSLDAWIFDRNDDSAEFGRVLYEPFLDSRVSTSPSSVGRLKGSYREPEE